jgi:hypothetical protein
MLPEISIATSLYPAAMPYLEDLMHSLEAACLGYACRFIVTTENIKGWEHMVPQEFTVHTQALQPGISLSQSRQNLFALAKQHAKNHVIFIDADDMMTRDAVQYYMAGLGSHDFVCGNMRLIDQLGAPLSYPPLYDAWNMKGVLENSDSLLGGNIIGLGAVALRKECLMAIPDVLPKEVIGVDWWVFTILLDQGFKGFLLEEPTILYRQHNNNVSGILNTLDKALLKKRTEIAIAHFQNLPTTQARKARLDALQQYFIYLDTLGVIENLKNTDLKPIPWYSDAIDLAFKNSRQTV